MRGMIICVLLMTAPALAVGPPDVGLDKDGYPLPRGALARFGSLRLWHEEQVLDCAFSPDGQRLAVLAMRGDDRYLALWDTAGGRRLGTIALAGEPAWHVAAAPDGRTLAVWGLDEIQLLDVRTGRVTRRLARDDLYLWHLAFSPDGKMLAAGCDSSGGPPTTRVRRWHLATGKELPRLTVEAPRVDRVSYSADGARLYAACGGERPVTRPRPAKGKPALVCEWEAISGKLVSSFRPDGEGPVLAPGGAVVALRGAADRYELWGLKTGKLIAALPDAAEDGPLFLPDGKSLVTASRTRRTLTLWAASTGRKLRELEGRLGRPDQLDADLPAAVSPDGKLLAARRSRGRWLRVWDLATGRELRLAGGHTSGVESLARSRDGRTVVTGDQGGLVLAWDAHTGRPRLAYQGHGHPVTALAVSPDGRLLASGDAGGGVEAWSLATGKRWHGRQRPVATPRAPFLQAGREHAPGVRAVAFSPDGRRLLEARVEEIALRRGDRVIAGALSLSDAATGAGAGQLRGANEAPLAISPDGRFAVVEAMLEGNRSYLRVVRLPLGGTVRRITPLARQGDRLVPTRDQGYAGVVFAPDGKTFAARLGLIDPRRDGFTGRSVAETVVYETATGEELLRVGDARPDRARPWSRPWVMAISPDGRLLAVRREASMRDHHDDRVVQLVDAETGRDRGQLRGHRAAVTCAAFSPDGARLYTGSEDRTVLMWDITRVAAAPAARPLTKGELDRLWLALAGDDARAAAAAVRALAARPPEAVPLLRRRLRPVAPGVREAVVRHIRDLASDTFAVRQRAHEALEALGGTAEAALAEALAGELELDTARRIDRLLARLDRLGPSPDALRATRATAALERMGTAEARRLLAALAKGAPGARLTDEAALAMRRLEARR